MAFLARPVRYAAGERVRREADADSTAFDDDVEELDR